MMNQFTAINSKFAKHWFNSICPKKYLNTLKCVRFSSFCLMSGFCLASLFVKNCELSNELVIFHTYEVNAQVPYRSAQVALSI